MTREHRAVGLRPDNLLAFLALLGLLRALEAAQPDWRPRVRWSLNEPPLRPVLCLRANISTGDVCDAAAGGAATLALSHAFGGRADLNHPVQDARMSLAAARAAGGYAAEVQAALMSDAAVKIENRKRLDQVQATPLALIFGQGHQHFLDRLATVPNVPAPPPRGRGNKATAVSAAQCMAEALFAPWARQDPTQSFRWDTAEDVRYALMYGDPSNAANKDGTQHGANRLAALGLAAFTAAPMQRGGEVRLTVPGGAWTEGFSLAWPIWAPPLGLAAIRNLLLTPDLRDLAAMRRFGVVQVRVARRISVGKFMNFTPGRPIEPEMRAAP